MMLDRGLSVAHTTIFRWVQRYAPELDKRCRPYLTPTNDSWRVDETYIKVRKQWKYLYRAVDSEGNTLDFLLTAKRDAKAAKRFLTKALGAAHTTDRKCLFCQSAKQSLLATYSSVIVMQSGSDRWRIGLLDVL